MSVNDPATRNKLVEKIKKLRAKGEGVGTTEAEANAFLDAAARLMSEHGVGDDDLAKSGIEKEPVEKRGVHTSIHKSHPACVCLNAIAQLTGTAIGLQVRTVTEGGKTREIGALTITGRPADRQVADFLYDQIRNMIDGAWQIERKSRIDRVAKVILAREPQTAASITGLMATRYVRQAMAETGIGVGHKERRSFGFGMAQRLSGRIEAMATRHADSANALAVWQSQTKVTDRKSKPIVIDPVAYARGEATGQTADIGRGVAAGQTETRSIGVAK